MALVIANKEVMMTAREKTEFIKLIEGLEQGTTDQNELWPVFLNTVFYVPLNAIKTAQGEQYTPAYAPSQVNPGVKSLVISQFGVDVAELSPQISQVQGGDLIQTLPPKTELIIPLGDNAFNIAAETVAWLRENARPA
ncbi:hypothetical protein [Motilimonas eburnea]|uniref:hypothetical protein n=1 Tax=Motilimonas eburnea TaxID=1737488 RepID=UPI001E404391|nr:hypothetical protein [Motilimonas eburnea]MCE2573101.1 hypothetical protein [Motilimonas eburnea]